MSATLPRSLIAALLLSLTTFPSPPAHGQASASDDAQRIARRKGEDALELYGAGRWAEALRLFRDAQRLYPAPTLLLYIARCQRKLGKLLDARAAYEQLVAEALPPGTSGVFLKAQTTGKAELAQLRDRIPVLKIVVKGIPPRAAKITLDDAPVSALPGNTTELDPGDHRIEASAAGASPVMRDFVVGEGETRTIELELRWNTAQAAQPAPTGAPDAASPGSQGSLVPGGVAFGLGAAGLVVGTVTGLLSLDKVRDLKSRCDEHNHCPETDASKADATRLLGDVSTAGFIVAGVGAAAGVALIIARPGGQKKTASEDTASKHGVQVQISPFALTLRGSF